MEDHQISLTEASAMTKNYRDANASTSNLILAHSIPISAINTLISQSDCVSMRVYYGLTADGSKELIFVGVDEDGNDIIGSSSVILDRTFKCPPFCGVANSLNGDADTTEPL